MHHKIYSFENLFVSKKRVEKKLNEDTFDLQSLLYFLSVLKNTNNFIWNRVDQRTKKFVRVKNIDNCL